MGYTSCTDNSAQQQSNISFTVVFHNTAVNSKKTLCQKQILVTKHTIVCISLESQNGLIHLPNLIIIKVKDWKLV